MKIDFANLKKAHEEYKDEIQQAVKQVMESSCFILGEEVEALEEELSNFIGSYAITCSSGTSAILLALLALGIKHGDEVITTPFSFIAAAEMIAFLGAKPVFVDINPHTFHLDVNLIEKAITKNTKAILPVSLFGFPPDMLAINTIAEKYSLTVIEDAAQSFGSSLDGKKSCNLSLLATTSFFPSKPLGCYGDGGAVFTYDKTLAEKIKTLRIHGQSKRYEHERLGIGARLDALQATILRIKLKYYINQIHRRQMVALQYEKCLQNKPVSLPFIPNNAKSIYAQYCILVSNRDELIRNLCKNAIPYSIHYPKPLHLQRCFAYLGYKEGDFKICEKICNEIISLPMNPYLDKHEIEFICRHV